MSTTTDTGFTPDEVIDTHVYTAYLAIASLPRSKTSPFAGDTRGTAGAYLMRIAGGGDISVIWGACRATNDDALRAMGVQHALKKYAPNVKLVVWTKGLGDYLAPGTGHVRYALKSGGRARSGLPFDAFDAFRDIVGAYDRGEWTLETARPRREPYGFVLASEMVQGLPLSTARTHYAFATVTETNIVLATSDDPDPHGLMKHGKG